MNAAEIQQFWFWVSVYRNDYHQRTGQAMMNALRMVAYPLYDDITGTDKDIFYRDSSQDIFRFRDYLGI